LNELVLVHPVMHINVRTIDHYEDFIHRKLIYWILFVYLETCLCTTAKRDSLYDDPAVSLTKNNERQSADQYGFIRAGKYRHSLRKNIC
jgi:hypothetical protein